jgi:hypothetical protein
MKPRSIILSFALSCAGLSVSCVAQTVPAADTIAAASPLISGRASHTATRLRGGRVLIAGGFGDDRRALRSTEIFDPKTGKFSAGPDMSEARLGHSATPLPDGSVLIAGGMNDGYLNAAEIFDAAALRFKPVGKMTRARSDHGSAVLGGGRVLIAGGVGTGWTFLSDAEIFDSGSGRFSPINGQMTAARESHTLTPLADGRVLIAGGHRGRRSEISIYDSAEIFDPQKGVFLPAGRMTVRRHKHDAVRLEDGRVMIIGGSDERDAEGKYRTTEIFDPAANRFERGPDMQFERFKFSGTSIVADGKVFVVGGAGRAEVYDPAKRAFTVLPGAFDTGRYFAAAVLLEDGRILVAGGYDSRIRIGNAAWLVDTGRSRS